MFLLSKCKNSVENLKASAGEDIFLSGWWKKTGYRESALKAERNGECYLVSNYKTQGVKYNF